MGSPGCWLRIGWTCGPVPCRDQRVWHCAHHRKRRLSATTVLKDAGYVHNLTPVVAVAIPDVPGGLNRVLQVLANANINVEYMYAFLGGKHSDGAYMISRVADAEAAEQTLAQRNIKTWSRTRCRGCRPQTGTARWNESRNGTVFFWRMGVLVF